MKVKFIIKGNPEGSHKDLMQAQNRMNAISFAPNRLLAALSEKMLPSLDACLCIDNLDRMMMTTTVFKTACRPRLCMGIPSNSTMQDSR